MLSKLRCDTLSWQRDSMFFFIPNHLHCGSRDDGSKLKLHLIFKMTPSNEEWVLFFQCLRPINQNKEIRIFLLCNLFFMTSHLFLFFHRSWWQTPNSDTIFSSRKYKIKRDSKCHFKLLFLARSVLKFVFLFSLQRTFF